jgi:hypothetical protein
MSVKESNQATAGPVKKWLRVSDAIDYSNLGKSTLYKALNDGRIKSVKVKGIRMASVESIESLHRELYRSLNDDRQLNTN